jgi:hypothetical protein
VEASGNDDDDDDDNDDDDDDLDSGLLFTERIPG